MEKLKKAPVYKKKGPTLRMKRVIKKMVENGGSLKKNMKAAGYSEGYAHNSQKLLQTKSFKELLKEVIPETMAADLNKKMMNSMDITYRTFPKKMEDKVIRKFFKKIGVEILDIILVKKSDDNKRVYFIEQDLKIAQPALDMYYKVEAAYAPIKIEREDPFEKKSDEELLAILKKIEDRQVRLKKKK